MNTSVQLLTMLRDDAGFRIDTITNNNPAAVVGNISTYCGEDLNATGAKALLKKLAFHHKDETVDNILNVKWRFGVNNAVDAALAEGGVTVDTPDGQPIIAGLEDGRGTTTKLAFLAVLPALSNLVQTALGGLLGGHQAHQAAQEQERQMQIAAAAQERQQWYASQNMKSILIAAGVGLVIIIVAVLAFRSRRKAS